jgi:uncharacterized protein
MSTTGVPRQADLRKLAAAAAGIEGRIELAELPRLSALLADKSGSVEVALRVGVDDEGYRVIEGHVRAAPRLQCQRCLGTVSVDVESRVCLAMVWREEEIPSLPSRFEGIVVGTEPTDLHALVEEELLLALPLVPRHPDGECRIAQDAQQDVPRHPGARENPFAALRGKLKG